MSELFDLLEICLQEVENGADVESVLARYPHHAAELRPILNTSIAVRSMSVPVPSPEVVRRGRAKVLQHAAQMRESKSAPRSKHAIPAIQRFAIAFTLAALFLSSGTGLVSASSSALPGENLYPVKLTWENIRLFFTFNVEAREALEHSFKNERLNEVNELLSEGRDETIRFAGVYMEVNGVTYVAGVRIVISETSVLPAQPLSNGMAVMVTGRTNGQGFVDVAFIALLPEGAVVPSGIPAETQENRSADNLFPADVNGNDSKKETNVNERSVENGNEDDSVNSNESILNNNDNDSKKDSSNNDNDGNNRRDDKGKDKNDDGGDDDGGDD